MSIEPEWHSEWEMDENSGRRVPLLNLRDIKIKCNHYFNPQEAINKWNSRKSKINYNNLYIEMYTETMRIAEQFEQIDTGCKKICFVPFETDLKSCVTLREMTGKKNFYETVNGAVNIHAGCRYYNLFSLFKDKIDFREYEY